MPPASAAVRMAKRGGRVQLHPRGSALHYILDGSLSHPAVLNVGSVIFAGSYL